MWEYFDVAGKANCNWKDFDVIGNGFSQCGMELSNLRNSD